MACVGSNVNMSSVCRSFMFLNVLPAPKGWPPHLLNCPPPTSLHLSRRNSLSAPQVAYFYPFLPRPIPICHTARHVGARCCQSLISHCVPLTFPSSSRFKAAKYIPLFETGGDLGEHAALAQVGWQAGVGRAAVGFWCGSSDHNDVLIKPPMSTGASRTSPSFPVRPAFSSIAQRVP